MAFGIDDALSAAAQAINLAQTVVEVINRQRQKRQTVDLELLLKEVRIEAIERIKSADLALAQLERTLVDRKIDLATRLPDVVAKTPFWRPFEQYRLSRIHKRFNELSDSIYKAADDIAALLRCHEDTREMGAAIVESTKAKHELHAKLLHAHSVKESIDLLRAELVRHQQALGR